MSLRAIHDFELALLDPCIAMCERGLPVDDVRRQRMIADLAAERIPLAQAASDYVTQVVLPTYAERLAPAKAHLFVTRKVCTCCRNGKAKRMACWACAGWERKPTRKQETALVDVGTPLKPCTVCAGAGAAHVHEFNPASPEQAKIVLYDLLRLPKRLKAGSVTADERALKSLLAECDGKPEARELILRLLRLGKMDTIASILVRIAPGPDGCIHTVYNPAGTETGRFNSSETFLIESTNLSNLPKREATEPRFDVRACIVPLPEHVFIEADFSGAEAWITACCAQDHELLKVLRSGTKIHRWTASKALHKPEAEVTAQEYSLYKTARHALNYGMQWKTFMENVNAVADRTGVAITAKQAKATHDAYHALHPNLGKRWWPEVQGALVRDGTLTTCFGRTRAFYGRARGEWLGEAHREAIAFEPQSTIADLLNRGLMRWWRQHDGKVGELLAQVYDSMLIMCRRERAPLVARLVQRCMTEEIEVHGIRITIPVDVKVLESWAVQPEPEAREHA